MGGNVKTLAEICGYRLYLDDGNYTIAKVTTVPELKKDGTPNKEAGMEKLVDHMYYGRLDHAVRRLGELVGDDAGECLETWLETFNWACTNVIEQLKGVK
jgi:hypothetical protein